MEIRASGGGWGRHCTQQGNSYWGLVWKGVGGRGGSPHISSRQREGINEAIKACSLRSIVGGRAG